MTDDWKGSHRGFQAHKKKKPPQQQQQHNRLRSRRKIGTRSTLYWATIKYGRDCLMLAMSSCADEYDSERHFRPEAVSNPLLHLVARLHGLGRLCAKHPIRGHSPFDFAFIFLLNNS